MSTPSRNIPNTFDSLQTTIKKEDIQASISNYTSETHISFNDLLSCIIFNYGTTTKSDFSCIYDIKHQKYIEESYLNLLLTTLLSEDGLHWAIAITTKDSFKDRIKFIYNTQLAEGLIVTSDYNPEKDKNDASDDDYEPIDRVQRQKNLSQLST